MFEKHSKAGSSSKIARLQFFAMSTTPTIKFTFKNPTNYDNCLSTKSVNIFIGMYSLNAPPYSVYTSLKAPIPSLIESVLSSFYFFD